MGVDGGWQLLQLKRLAHNFVQLETAYDQLMPKSRRANSNAYCRSNKQAVTKNGGRTRTAALALIERCSSVAELMQLLCPDRNMKMNLGSDKCYKTNKKNLEGYGTVEFRHAGSSRNAAKVVAYVLLWVLLAEASVAHGAPLAVTPQQGDAFENLVAFYSNNPVVVHWLVQRRLELNPTGTTHNSHSCPPQPWHGCGGGCQCHDCNRLAVCHATA